MFRHILVPLDGSVRAERAIPVAARLARTSGGMVVLVRIIEDAFGYEHVASAGSPLFQATARSERKEAQQYLAGIASSHQLSGCPVIVSIRSGPVVAAIQTAIDTYQVDLIVCCEQPGLQNSPRFLSLFTEKLALHLSIPLLLLPAREPVNGSLAEIKQPLTCVVTFAGMQPEPFLIPPATALLAGLAEHKPAHLHFVPLHSVLSRSTMMWAEPMATALYHSHSASTQGAVLLKEASKVEKSGKGSDHVQGDVFILTIPRPGDSSDLLREMCVYPRLLIPSQRSEQ